MTRIIENLREISDRYDAAFVDLWGCLHNGVRAFPEAVRALQEFRQQGGTVVLLTNAPRPRAEVERQIARFGVPRDAWDTIATSGDAARVAMFRGAVGQKVWWIGQPHDEPFFDPPRVVADPLPIERVPLEEAEGIVVTGPFDPHADPSVYRPQLLYAKQKGLKLLCANPDIVVDRGERREWCAGAIARLYDELGGHSIYVGKPHPEIYDLARLRLNEVRPGVPDERILCIGDGILTDIQGAVAEDLDSLFVTGGLAAEETGTRTQPDPVRLSEYLRRHGLEPTWAIGFLR